MTTWNVLIGSRSFGQSFPEHLTQLEAAGCRVIPNTKGNAYREDELPEALRGMDAIITGTDALTAEVIAGADSLVTIAKHGVGLDNVDLDAAKHKGIVVTSTPEAIHDSVADHTMALLLALARNVVPLHNGVVNGTWKGTTGIELRGRTLGIVGLGRIGKGVCRRAQAFGMDVIAADPYVDEEFAGHYAVTYVPLDQLLAHSDVVSLHAAVGTGGGALIGEKELAAMRSTAFLINTARGSLIAEDALLRALEAGDIAGAGLDVFATEPPVESPLLHHPNVVLTPHIGGRTMEGLRRMGEMTVENCLRALRGELTI